MHTENSCQEGNCSSSNNPENIVLPQGKSYLYYSISVTHLVFSESDVYQDSFHHVYQAIYDFL